MRPTKLYNVWRCMKYRCHGEGKSNPYARWYRDRGIEVCSEWRNSFEEFKKWAESHGYKEGLSIDRINPDGNYCPENCRWVTMLENSKNARPACSVSWRNKNGDVVYATNPPRTVKMPPMRLKRREDEVIRRLTEMIESLDDSTRVNMMAFIEGLNFAAKRFGACNTTQ